MNSIISGREVSEVSGDPLPNMFVTMKRHGAWNEVRCIHCGLDLNIRVGHDPKRCPKCKAIINPRFIVKVQTEDVEHNVMEYSGKKHRNYYDAEIEECDAAKDVNVFDSWIEEVMA